MFGSIRRHRHSKIDLWAGFVDVLATVLMVIIFVLMAFVISQAFLTDTINLKDTALQSLNRKIQTLNTSLEEEKKQHSLSRQQIDQFKTLISDLEKHIFGMRNDLTYASKLTGKNALKEDTTDILTQLQILKDQLILLNQALESEQQKNQEQSTHITNLSEQLEKTLSEKIVEITELKKELEQYAEKNNELEGVIVEKDKKLNGAIGLYRSQFFANLKKAIGNRQDIRIVDDRFVFQSEVLFDKGSADLELEGKRRLDQLANALKDIADKIPTNVNWILRVDGHTDNLPIKTDKFPSNWELSSARAISVVKYLIAKGIPSHHLVAAGFGEFQPLDKGKAEALLSKNRRIEFKLDQR